VIAHEGSLGEEVKLWGRREERKHLLNKYYYAYVKGKAKVGRNIGPTRLSIILGSLYDIVLLYPWP